MSENTITTFGFPFAINQKGNINAIGGDEAIRSKIIQVLFTAPGERVNMPEFGCGLFNLLFEPNNAVLTASTQFAIGQALSQWMKDDIVVEQVNVTSEETTIAAEIVYSKKNDASRDAVRIFFS